MNSILRFLEYAETSPKQVCLIEKGRRITYHDLNRQAALAQERLMRQGIGKGDQVLILQPMSTALYALLIALWGIGAVPVFLDAGFFKAHGKRIPDLLQLKALVTGHKGLWYSYVDATLRAVPLKLHTNWLLRVAPPWHHSRLLCHDVTAAHAGLITLTSGSTGIPKVAVRSHGFLQIQSQMLGEALNYVPGITELATMPVFALANLAHGLITLIPSIDFSHVGEYRPEVVWRELQQSGAKRIMAAPGFLQRLLDHALDQGLSNNEVEAIHTGGAPIFTPLLDQLRCIFPKARIIAIYGSTEAEPIAIREVTVLSDTELERIATGEGLPAGRIVVGVECHIIRNRHGESLADLSEEAFAALCLTHEVGEIVVSGDNVLAGYLNGIGDRENKFSVNGRRFHRTGDLGRFDADGQLWLLGRAGQAISDAWGEIWPLSVEAAVKMYFFQERLAFLQHQERRTLVLEREKPLTAEQESLLRQKLAWAHLEVILTVRRLPVDPRHNSKIDYPALRKLLERR